MSEKNFKPAQTQAYRFEFGSDGEIRTVSFKGRLPEEEADKVLEAAGRRAYKDAGAAIRSYLERQGLEYSGFESREAVLKHGEIMEWADALLHSGACRAIGARRQCGPLLRSHGPSGMDPGRLLRRMLLRREKERTAQPSQGMEPASCHRADVSAR